VIAAAGKRLHFVGIGGAGMSGLARVMMARGARVTGSDIHESDETRRLRRAGVEVHLGHDPTILDEPIDAVIVSSAIDEENPELRAARHRAVPIVRRLHALAALLDGYQSIGVAGTHGKTTTSAMIATILIEVGLDPSYLIGAHCPGLGGNAHLGSSPLFVTEVDESDGLFLGLRPSISVLNNIGCDHLSTYRDLGEIEASFLQYLNQSGRSVLSIDDVLVRGFVGRSPAPLTVGTSTDADLRATRITPRRFETRFELTVGGRRVGSVRLPAPGVHNVRNALCAIGAAYLAGVKPRDAAEALEAFRLPHRRFELLEENGVTVVDDYAHLPAEIEATLQAIQDGWEGRRIVALFQPHRFTRTRAIGPEFGAAFADADTVLVLPIYPASEAPIPGVSSQCIADAIVAATDADVFRIGSKDEGLRFLTSYIEPGDFIISFGAGDIWTVTEELSCFLKEGSFCAS